jgi:asparagine synthase (glutamine-hydrolysing)
MCGLAGILSLDGRTDLRGPIERMTNSLVHRGPDDSGVLVENQLALGFRRLSILDLEQTGHQPMTSADGSCTLVFNGEIYNYLELRKDLEKRGYNFRSTGDTEVLLNAYCEWGRECLSKLNGMWAFLIYDRRRNIIFGSRDRFGIKPLYIHRGKQSVLFGSEIKAICASGMYRKEMDWETIADFLVRKQLDQSDRTFFSGIEQIPAGSAFELDFGGQIEISQFWSLTNLEPFDFDDPIEAYGEIFEDAVRLRTRSDVPIGVFLSGGVDSTAILCSLARTRNNLPSKDQGRLRALAFMDPRFDERRFIDDTILQTGAELEQVDYDSSSIWEDLPKVLWHHDQPVHSTTALIGYRLSQAAAEQGIKVILNGQGADETAAGYQSYFQAYWHTILAAGGVGALYKELEQHALLWGGDPKRNFLNIMRYKLSGQLYRFQSYRKLRSHFDRKKNLRHPWFTSELLDSLRPAEGRQNVRLDLNTELQAAVEHSPMPLYLRIEDRNSMAHSVEVRVPFLDYRLVSLLFSSPGESKMQGPFNKHIVRESMRGRIPDSVRNRHEKMGFPSPAGVWMSELKDNFLDTLNSVQFRELGIFNVAEIKQQFERHCSGQVDIGREVFDVLQFLLWHEMTNKQGSTSFDT